MITYDEIRTKADEFDIHTSDVQRDYVFSWVAAAVAGDELLGPQLVLKGGNALRKGYFPATRFSDDLDYSTPAAIGDKVLLERFASVCRHAEARSGIAFEIERTYLAPEPQLIEGDRQVQRMRLYFRDFTGTTQELVLRVRVDITEFDRLVLAPQTRRIIHPYSDAAECNDVITCVKLEEALADKLRALMHRQHAHDLFDLVYGVFVRHEFDVNRFEIVRTFLRKSMFERDAPAAKNVLLGLPFELMRQFWTKLVMPRATRFSFDEAMRRFAEGLTELFAPFAVSEARATGYFPAESRALILRAGTHRTVLELTYHGVTRLVEPYALVFKRPAGRGVREYFYGYDLTGGRRSGPGIKSFFPEEIQALAATDQPFTPRFPVELTASGESAVGTFARPFSTGPRRVSRSVSILQYRVRCPVCDKVFRRSRPTTRLNPHKDRYGNRCYGRVGYLEY